MIIAPSPHKIVPNPIFVVPNGCFLPSFVQSMVRKLPKQTAKIAEIVWNEAAGISTPKITRFTFSS